MKAKPEETKAVTPAQIRTMAGGGFGTVKRPEPEPKPEDKKVETEEDGA